MAMGGDPRFWLAVGLAAAVGTGLSIVSGRRNRHVVPAPSPGRTALPQAAGQLTR